MNYPPRFFFPQPFVPTILSDRTFGCRKLKASRKFLMSESVEKKKKLEIIQRVRKCIEKEKKLRTTKKEKGEREKGRNGGGGIFLEDA